MNSIRSNAWVFSCKVMDDAITKKWIDEELVKYAVYCVRSLYKGDKVGVIKGYVRFKREWRACEVRKALGIKDLFLDISYKDMQVGTNYVIRSEGMISGPFVVGSMETIKPVQTYRLEPPSGVSIGPTVAAIQAEKKRQIDNPEPDTHKKQKT